MAAILVIGWMPQCDVGEGDVRAVKRGAERGVPVKEILEVEDGGVAHGRGGEVFEELCVRSV